MSKILNDPIHGYIKMPKYCLEIIDTPQFQRLRELKQMGPSHYVFPGAVHTRFEHSLGVSYLSGKFYKKLVDNSEDLNIELNDIKLEEKLLRIAGLCHDIGHSVMSHSFEQWVHTKDINFSHEEMGTKILKYLVDDNSIDLNSKELSSINDIITGKGFGYKYEIVANMVNSIDVDKFDYISRDCRNVGIGYSYDFDRLINFSKIIKEHIYFDIKEAYNIFELFQTRYRLHKTVYNHPVSQAINLMFQDIFNEADDVLELSSRIRNVEDYLTITDGIIREIENSKMWSLEKSRSLIKRIRKRNLYKLVYERIIPHQINVKPSDLGLNNQDISILSFSIDYTRGNKNPLDNVNFYSKKANRETTSILPSTFSESYLRVYTKNFPVKFVSKSLDDWLKNKYGF